MTQQTIDQAKLAHLDCPRCSCRMVPSNVVVLAWINYDCLECKMVVPRKLADVYADYSFSLRQFSS